MFACHVMSCQVAMLLESCVVCQVISCAIISYVIISRPLRIGYYMTDDICKPTPAVTRAMEMTIQALKTAGHEVIPFQPPR